MGRRKKKKAAHFDPFLGPELLYCAPTTEAQREIWLAAQISDDANRCFNESLVFHLRGELKLEEFTAAFDDVVGQHESFRCSFSPDGLLMCIAAAGPKVRVHDFRNSSNAEQAEAVQRFCESAVCCSMPLVRGPLVTADVVRLSDIENIFVFCAHHIICDGWSLAVFAEDLGNAYSKRVLEDNAEVVTRPRLSDYAREEHRFVQHLDFKNTLDYWQQEFETLPPPLNIRGSKHRPPLKTYPSRRIDHTLADVSVQALRDLCKRERVSFFTLALAGFQVMLHGLSSEEDIVVGIPSAGQSSSGLDHLCGHCVNMLPLRQRVLGDIEFGKHLGTTKSTVLDAYENQRLTFASLLKSLKLKRDPSRLPLLSVLFNVDQGISGAKLKFEGLDVVYRSNPRLFETFDMFLNIVDKKNSVCFELQYNTDLFDAATVEGWMLCLENYFVLASKNTQTSVGEFISEGLSVDRVESIVRGPIVPIDQNALVFSAFVEHARTSPKSIALRFNDEAWSYQKLYRRAVDYAQALRDGGIGKSERVAVLMERSPEAVAALLGVQFVGAAYIPLDPRFPTARLEMMLKDSDPILCISSDSNFKLPDSCSGSVLFEDEVVVSTKEFEHSPMASSSCAYMIYTSGSTGVPKAVQVSHRSALNFLQSMAQRPGLKPGDTLLAVTTFSFDIAVLELFLPLFCGTEVVLAPEESVVDGKMLSALITKYSVSVMQATPATWRILLAEDFVFPANFRALCGGESLPEDLCTEFLRRGVSLWNMYGPTETTVWSTCANLNDAKSVHIGTPIDNTQCLVMTPDLGVLPRGEVGELFIAGEGVTLGYYQRPELNADKYIKHPVFGRMYRSGDLARLSVEGALFCLGRIDHQVKIRGFRIELGDIETQLMKLDGVDEAVVCTHEFSSGDHRLIAYVRGQKRELSSELERVLPRYMLPQHYEWLSKFPLTPNSKVDRQALKPSRSPMRDVYLKSENGLEGVELQISAIWREVLGHGDFKEDDDFFEQGGHSLLAAQVVAKLRDIFGIEASMRLLFEAPTLKRLAQRIVRSKNTERETESSVIPKHQSPAPLSSQQRRIFFLEELNPKTALFNLPSFFRLRGPLNIDALSNALIAVSQRHEAMRTVFEENSEGELRQRVLATSTLKVPLIDLREDCPAGETLFDFSGKYFQDISGRPFDLLGEVLCRAAIYKLGDDHHVLFFSAHHAIWDGWSFDIFLKDLDLYYRRLQGENIEDIEDLSVHYPDYCAWQNHEGLSQYDGEIEFWKEKLLGILPVLELPSTKKRDAVFEPLAYRLPLAFSKSTAQALEAIGQAEGATLYMVLLTVFKIMLSKFSNEADILVGTPIRGRNLSVLENTIGYFVNTVVLRTDLSGDPGFNDVLRRVRAAAIEAFEHENLPFERLLEVLDTPRDHSRTPVYQSFFVFQDIRNRTSTIGEFEYEQIDLSAEVSSTDLELWFKYRDDKLVGGLNVARSVFELDDAQFFVDAFVLAVERLVDKPQLRAAELFAPTEDECLALARVNQTAAPRDEDLTVIELFEEQVDTRPEALAVRDELGLSLSYAELLERSTAIAETLIKSGAGPHSFVGLCVKRGCDMVAATLGIMRIGAAYVPLDPNFPAQRLELMIEDAELAIILSDGESQEILPSGKFEVLLLDDVDDCEDEVPCEANFGAAAYMIYTSGSSGVPKGVQVSHGALANFLLSMQNNPGFHEDDCILALTTLSFDISKLELFLALISGGHIIVADSESASDGELLHEVIEEHGVNYMQATPTTWRLLLAEGFAPPSGFRALCGGEALSLDLATALGESGVELWNMYGPTETTIWSTLWKVPKAPSEILIGAPIENTQIDVVDSKLRSVPACVKGELLIAGAGLALGYWHREALNREKFVRRNDNGRLWYRSGDVVSLNRDGMLCYHRRLDQQVKVRGYRIELGDINAGIRTLPEVLEVETVVYHGDVDDARLVSYYVAQNTIDDAQFRRALRQTLPDYMIPQVFIKLDRMPMTPNNKIDRKKLPSPGYLSAQRAEYDPPIGDLEIQMASIWSDVLKQDRISRTDNFFEIGGHSLLCLQLTSKIHKALGIKISPRLVLRNSLSQLVAVLKGELEV